MIVRFDTPELAEKRFKELKEKHNPSGQYYFFFTKRIEEGEENVGITYWLRWRSAEIEVTVVAHTLVNLTTAMKIVDMMQEV